MLDALETITKLINSPPGQLAAGGVLAGIVWKFFERVEAVLADQTKLEIAVWLLDRKKLSPTFQNWPDTFAKIFDRVFGKRHVSLHCFFASAIASFGIQIVILMLGSYSTVTLRYAVRQFLVILAVNAIPDYISLLESRYILKLMTQWKRPRYWFGLLLVDFCVTSLIASMAVTVGFSLLWQTRNSPSLSQDSVQMISTIQAWLRALPVLFVDAVRLLFRLPKLMRNWNWIWVLLKLWFFPAFFTSIWVWLYAGSGFLLKAARRFDIGFDWFSRKFDIEKKPLQSIGLVAGALMALVYWTAVIFRRAIG